MTITWWVLTIMFMMPAQEGQLPKSGRIDIVFKTEDACRHSPERELIVSSIVAPYGSSLIECNPVTIIPKREVK